MPYKILIVAGEASGDCHGASLVKAINNITPSIKFYGLGGEDMQNAGVNILYNITNLAVIGHVDLIKNYSKLRKIYDDLCRLIKDERFDAAILIDYPGFNLKIAKDLKSQGIPIIYYISPQIWAWWFKRIKKIKQFVDKMLVLFEFEKNLYQKENISVTLVGHPLLDTVKQTKDENQLISEYGLDSKKITIGILPGSRNNEVTMILPIMIKAARLIQQRVGPDNVQFLLPLAKTQKKEFVESMLKGMNFYVKTIEDDTYNAVSICKIAMVASGTATLETALLGIPFAIIYKVNLFTYLIARSVIKIPYIGVVNIISQEKIVPEFIQYEARPKVMADYLIKLLQDENYYDEIKRRLSNIKSKLGSPGASMRAAREVVDFLQSR